jgi:hypothetical protein
MLGAFELIGETELADSADLAVEFTAGAEPGVFELHPEIMTATSSQTLRDAMRFIASPCWRPVAASI